MGLEADGRPTVMAVPCRFGSRLGKNGRSSPGSPPSAMKNEYHSFRSQRASAQPTVGRHLAGGVQPSSLRKPVGSGRGRRAICAGWMGAREGRKFSGASMLWDCSTPARRGQAIRFVCISLLRLCNYESPMKRFPSHGVVKFLCGRRRRRRPPSPPPAAAAAAVRPS